MVYVTAPLNIIDKPADAKHYTRGRRVLPRVIILHHTGGIDSTLWLTKTSAPPVSCNRLIGRDGSIYKIVADGDTAYAQGNSTMGPYHKDGVLSMNDIGLSIELENLGNGIERYPDLQVYSCALQVHEWWGKYGLLPVLGHRMVDTRKTDPRDFPWDNFYDLLHGLITGFR